MSRRGKRAAAEKVAGPAPKQGHANGPETDARMQVVYDWVVRAKPTAWKYAEARRLWNIGDRMYRKIEQRVLEQMRLSRSEARPFDHETAVARLERLIDESFEKGDREEARRATFTLHRITVGMSAPGDPAPPPAPTGHTQVNIGKLVIDLRGSSPIEKQKRLAELDARRARLLGPGRAPVRLDPTEDDEAEGEHGRSQDER